MLNLLIKDIHGGDTIYCIKDIECYKKGEFYTLGAGEYISQFYKLGGGTTTIGYCFIRVPTEDELENEFIQLKFLKDNLSKDNIAEINCKNFQEFKDKIASCDSICFLHNKDFNFSDLDDNFMKDIIIEFGEIIEWGRRVNQLINFTNLYIESEDELKSMTKEEIEDELGYKIKIASK